MLKLNSRGSSSFLSQPVVLIAMMGLVGAGAIFGYRFYLQSTGNASLLNAGGSQNLIEEQTKQLLEKIGKHAVLPEDEEPVVATVTDVEKLISQDFFKTAQNGDRVVVYTQAKIAILYREDIDRIVNMAPFTGDPIADFGGPSQGADNNQEAGTVEGTEDEQQEVDSGQEAAETPVEVDLVRLAIYNGTSNENITSSINLQEDFDDIDFSIIERRKAAEEYTDTIVVDLTGVKSDIAGRVGQLVGGTVSTLPENEEAIDVDILIIVGSSFLE